MGTMGARTHARRAQRESNVEDKLDEIAKAIYELANSLDEVEREIKRLR